MTEPKVLPEILEFVKQFTPHLKYMPIEHQESVAKCCLEILSRLPQSVLSPLEEEAKVSWSKSATQTLEADKVTLAFFQKYLEMPNGTLEEMCREIIRLKTFSPKSDGLVAFTREDIVELHNAFQYRKNVSPNNYEIYKNEIIDTFIERFGSKALEEVAPREVSEADIIAVLDCLTFTKEMFQDEQWFVMKGIIARAIRERLQK